MIYIFVMKLNLEYRHLPTSNWCLMDFFCGIIIGSFCGIIIGSYLEKSGWSFFPWNSVVLYFYFYVQCFFFDSKQTNRCLMIHKNDCFQQITVISIKMQKSSKFDAKLTTAKYGWVDELPQMMTWTIIVRNWIGVKYKSE